ncbi:MAG: efflux RND transporter permease subunit [Spartobacteria bacterium]|nr:efflux RND transporter permease subunit [Spartobacteria bacterium]
MNIAGWCIKNNRTALVAFLLIVLAGINAFNTIPRLEDPEFTIRVASVITQFPGASPQKIEELITDKIEQKIQEIGEVDVITSESRTGMSLVMVEIESAYKDQLSDIWTRLRNKMEDIKPELPEGVYGPFVNDEYGDVFPVVISLTGDGFTYRELKDIADTTRDELLTIPSVAKVDLYGVQEERIFVEFSNARLADFGMTPDELAAALEAQNVLSPGGIAVENGESITIEASGEFKTLEDVKQVSIRKMGSSETVYLRDVAYIWRGFVDPPESLTRFNSDPCLMMAVSMATGNKVTEMGEYIRAAVDRLQTLQPVGVNYDVFVYQPRYVARSIDEFMGNLFQAFVFVVIVMLLFCGLRMGLIAGSLVPMAMLMCLALMPYFKISLHSVSIASLIIALGMLVDNGIVTSEDMLVRLARGDDRMKAARDSVTQLWMPLLAASLTTICAFMTIALADSDVAEFCLSLFQVVTITLLASWLLSITLVPMLCYYFLKPKKSNQDFTGKLYEIYRAALFACLRYRAAFLALIAVLLGVSLYCFRFVPSIFFPPNSREMFLVDFWQPYGTDVRTTADRLEKLESFLLEHTNVVSVGCFIGNGGPRWMLSLNVEEDNPNYASVIVNTAEKSDVPTLMKDTLAYLENNFPDGRFTVKELETGPAVGAPIQIRLSGKDIDTIYKLRDRISAALAGVPGVVNIRDDWGEWTKKLQVNVNQEQAKLSGFTSQDVAASLKNQISGLHATDFREGKEIIPIEIRSTHSLREDLGRIETLNIYSYTTGQNAPLLQLAHVGLEWQPSDIRRRNTLRTMTIKTDVIGRYASDVLLEARPAIEALTAGDEWPNGYNVEFGGEDEDSAKAMDSIMDTLPLAFGCLALVLIAQFNSLRRPLIIVITVPPMFIGIVFGLLLTGEPFGFMAFLGMISLMGIIVNNAIMMIDRIEIERELGQTMQDAVTVAAQKRARPILMTAITTIVGLVPLSLQGGPMWRPMANTIIFGLAFATVLTLLLCPILYSYFFRVPFHEYKWDPEVLKRSED